MTQLTSFNTPAITKKLVEISEVMADGVHFIHMRLLVEDWQARADAGDDGAEAAIRMIEQFHRLCVAVKK